MDHRHISVERLIGEGLNYPEEYLSLATPGWDSTSGLMLLKEAPLPQDILKIGVGGISQIWREAKVRVAGLKKAQTLVEAT